MTAEPRWIGKRALLLLHEESLAEFGGARGLRDEVLLDSALARAQNAWAYGDGRSMIAKLAAQYGYGLAKNHAFVDGNKRMAFLAIGLFLALNRCRLKAGKAAAVKTMLAVAAGTLDERGLAAWIQAHIEPE
jgi:death-on-curing protein